MEVEVKLFGSVREDIGEKTLRRTLPEKATVDDVARLLVWVFVDSQGRAWSDIDSHHHYYLFTFYPR